MLTRFIPILAVLVLVGSACSTESSSSTSKTSSASGSTATSHSAPTTAAPIETTTTSVSTTIELPGRPIEIFVEDGEVVDGAANIGADLGSEVWIVVHSNTADHVHVHGYDIFYDVAADEPAEIKFLADIPGVFEIELEGAHTVLAELEVS